YYTGAGARPAHLHSHHAAAIAHLRRRGGAHTHSRRLGVRLQELHAGSQAAGPYQGPGPYRIPAELDRAAEIHLEDFTAACGYRLAGLLRHAPAHGLAAHRHLYGNPDFAVADLQSGAVAAAGICAVRADRHSPAALLLSQEDAHDQAGG